jgi:hypothetical protein
MTSTTRVKAHDRRKPEKPAVYLEKHAQLRAEIAVLKKPAAASRASVPTGRPIDAVLYYAGKLKSLVAEGRH